MIEQKNPSFQWYASLETRAGKKANYGPFESKLDALIACFPEIVITRILQGEPQKTESKQERVLESTNDFKDSEIFPCDIIPKKRLD